MATTKKNTTTKKTNTTKGSAAKKANTTPKKPAESTGVIDEFLNENIGKVVKETPKTEPKKKAAPKKKENKPTETDGVIFAPYTLAETIEIVNSENEIDSKYAKQEVNPEYYSEFNIESVNEAAKVINEQQDSEEKTPEEKWKDLGLDSEAQEDIKDVVDNILDENGIDKEVFESAVKAEATKIGVSFDEIKQPKEEEKDGKHIIEISDEDYQEIAKMMLQDAEELIEGKDDKEEKKENVENIKIGQKLEPKKEEKPVNPLSITFVTSAMGVSYD